MTAAGTFRALHDAPGIFVMPNPFDIGTARLLAAKGFKAIASSSSALGFMLGKADQANAIGRTASIAHLRMLVVATDLPVNGDLENGYGPRPEDAAETVRLAMDVGAAGCSIEDASGDKADPLYDIGLAAERIAACRAAVAAEKSDFVLTARAECFLVGHDDPLAESIRRLKAYEAAGADVLYAPGLASADQIKAVLDAVSKPVNVLPGFGRVPLSIAELGALGVKRASLGSWLHNAALGGFLAAVDELAEAGTMGFRASCPRPADKAAAFDAA